MTDFTRTSPTSGAAVPDGVTEIGGIVIDLIGLNGTRVVSQIAASTLFEGFYNDGVPVSYQGNPGIIGIQSGFSAAALQALGGGIAALAIRLTLYDGDSATGDFDSNSDTLRLNGVEVGNFSSIATQITSDDGLTLFGSDFGFRNDQLATGWFLVEDGPALGSIYQSLSSTGALAVSLRDQSPYDNFFDFTRGIDGSLIDVGSPPNISPVAADDSVAASADGSTAIDAAILLANDVDPDGTATPLVVESVSATSAAGAAVSLVNGSIVYDPGNRFAALGSGETAIDTFDYAVRDAGGLISTATVTVEVQGVNDAPVAADDVVTLDARASIVDLAELLLGNDSDIDGGDMLRIVAVEADDGVGTLRFNPANGSLSYAADDAEAKALAPGETATFSFSYTTADSAGATSTASVTLEVIGTENNAPAASDDAFTVSETGILTGDLVVGNGSGADSDVDDDTLVVTAVNGAARAAGTILLPSGAQLLVGADGAFSYDPNGAFDALRLGQTATDSFTYQVSDGYGGTDEAMATVTIQGAGGTTVSIQAGGALATGETGTATLVYADTSGGTLAPGLLLVRAEGALVADPLTGGFASQALIFTAGGAASVEIPVTVRMAASADTRASLTAAVANPDAAIDWAALKDGLQPGSVPDAAWDRIFDAFLDAVGGTVGSLTASLADDAALLTRFGIGGGSGAAALAFELEQAGDFGSIAARAEEGSFGQGWSALADLALDIGEDGTVVLRGLSDTSGLFSLRVGDAVTYVASASVGRTVDLAGNLIGSAAPAKLAFDPLLTGDFAARGGAGAGLAQTADGYALTAPNGAVLRFDGTGRLIEATDVAGSVTQVVRGAGGRIVGFSGADGASLTFDRAADGHVVGIADSRGGALAFDYDAAGKSLVKSSGSQGTTLFGYNASGDLDTVDRAGGGYTLGYDEAGRLTQIGLADGVTAQSFTYDATGGYTVADAAVRTLTVALLPGGIAGGATDAAGVSTELRFSADGTLIGTASSDGSTQAIATDALGRITSVTDANGATIAYQYDGDALRPSAFFDANGEARQFAYDAAGRLTGVTWADDEQLGLDYDVAGNLVMSANRRGQDIDYSYDGGGRLLSVSDSSAGAVAYAYDAAGRLASATTAAGVTAVNYDSAGRVDRVTFPDGRYLGYDYDAAGRRTAMTDQDGRAQTWSYDAAGRLAAVGDEGGTLVTYSYDAGGNLAGEANANGTATAYAYDAAGRLAEIVNGDADGAVNSFNRYTYDDGGRRATMTTQDGAWAYGYDAAGQLTSAVFASTNPAVGDKSIVYTYNAAGNRTAAVEDGVTTDYAVGGLNRYTSAGGESFAYDADGNLTTRVGPAGATSYAYDVGNRLSSVTAADGRVTTYEYDVFGNRSAVVEDGVRTAMLVDPFGLGNLVREYGADGSLVARYVHGLGLAARSDAAGADAFYDADAVGSVVGVSGADGALVDRYAYTPFGTALYEQEGLENRFEFNGLFGVEEDATGLSYMRARQYDAGLGRFVMEDSAFDRGDAGNLYRYALNDPTAFIDPAGQFPDLAGVGKLLPGLRVVSLAVGLEAFALTGSAAVAGAAATGVAAAGVLALGYTAFSTGYYLGEALAKIGVGLAYDDNELLKEGASDLAGRFIEKAIFKGVPLGPLAKKITEKVAEGVTGYDLKDVISDFFDKLVGDSSDVNIPTKPNPASKSDGDPHIATFDGLAYDFQAVGEFILMRGEGLEVQTRQEAIGANVAINTATAIRVGDDVVGIYAKQANPLVINGRAVALDVGETIAIGGGSVYRADFNGSEAFKVYVVTNESGDGFWVNVYNGANHLRPFVSDERGSDVEGLLGNHDGDRTNDIALADGTVISGPVAAQTLYGAYADGWRITDAISLFVYADGQSTETFTNRNFPAKIVTLADLDPDARAMGEAAALAAGLVPGTIEFDNAVLDVAATGDPAFAQAIAATPEPTVTDPEPLVVQRAPTLVPDVASTAEDVLVLIDVLANDSDPEGDELMLTQAFDANGGVVTISEGKLAFTPKADFSGKTTLTYSVRDAAGNEVSSTVAVTVAAVADAPVIGSDGGLDAAVLTVQEGAVAVTTVAASDPDAETMLAYAIAGGSDAALFAIDPVTGALAFLTAPDFENPGDGDRDNRYEIVVSASDGVLTDSQALSVVVTDRDESIPTFPGTGSGPDRYEVPPDATGALSIPAFGRNDTLVLHTPLVDRNGDGIITFGKNGLLDLDVTNAQGATIDVTTINGRTGVRALGSRDGEFFYADATVRPKGAIEGTIGNDALNGTAAKDSFFFDTALGIGLGRDTIRNFGANDRIITTTALSDGNGDGFIGFGRNRLLELPDPDGDATTPGGILAIYGTSGKQITGLELLQASELDGVTYYYYGL